MIFSIRNTLFLLPLAALALGVPTNGNVDARDVQASEIDAAIAEQIVDAVSGLHARSNLARSDVVSFVNEALQKRDVIVARADKDKTLKKKPKLENLRDWVPAGEVRANRPPKQDNQQTKKPQSNNPNPNNVGPGGSGSRWSPDSSNSGKGSKWGKVKDHFLGKKKKN
ncbi:hypothetical protein MAPG_00805 [Magnaporthiopsis poae ATCC 64411]|uniref:Uncharacterized protein n=1 Tax=Magnaporthiopsis poae (strain ATCC 64411 / 73-15) TaxID=644358 RepID=A0A0C4DM04_MAGP6|nr:hypothetical protein MAPG_00805 [Magnaporthiopsis poae ATCC 64411]